MIRLLLLINTLCATLFGAVHDITPTDYQSAKSGATVMSLNYLHKNLTGPCQARR